MAIVYNNGADGTLKPPTLLGINSIESEFGEGLGLLGQPNLSLVANNQAYVQAPTVEVFGIDSATINSDTNTTISSGNNLYLTAYNIFIQNGGGSLDLFLENAIFQLTNNLNLFSGGVMTLNSATRIELQTPTVFGGLPTADILALTPSIGMQFFCTTINQMVFYQVSPITGTVLGWYNSTGTIKL